MLSELAGALGLDPMQVVRRLIFVEHRRMVAHLKEHELPAGTLLQLDTSGEFVHREILPWDRKRVVRNIEGALVLEEYSSRLLHRMAATTKLKPEKIVSDLLDAAAVGTPLEPKWGGVLASSIGTVSTVS